MALQPTKAREYRNRKKPYLFQVNGHLTVLVKRVDMVSMIVTGAIPMPLLDAADKFQKVRDEITENTSPEEAIKKLKAAGDDGEFREFLEKYAAHVVIEPRIYVGKGPVPENAIPADELELMELLAIWNAHPEDEAPAPEVPSAISFRDEERVVPGPATPSGEDVRPASKSLDQPIAEFVYH